MVDVPVTALVVGTLFVVVFVAVVVVFTGIDDVVHGRLQERRLRKEWWTDVARRRGRRR